MSDIVRELPPLDAALKWSAEDIPDSNAAKELSLNIKHFQYALDNYIGLSIDIYYNSSKGIVTHNPFGEGYVKIPYADFEFAIGKYRQYQHDCTRLINLHKSCEKLIKPTDFVLYNGIKYGNTLENCKKLTKLYSTIVRELPDFHEVTEPVATKYKITFKRIYLKLERGPFNDARNSLDSISRYMCHLKEFIIEHKIPDIDEDYEILIERCYKRCDKCVNNVDKGYCDDYLIMSGHTLHKVLNDQKNAELIEENKKIFALYRDVYNLTEPLQYVKYDYVRYGNPNLRIHIA